MILFIWWSRKGATEFIDCQGQAGVKGLTVQGTFCGDGNILYNDFDGGYRVVYIYENSSMVKVGEFFRAFACAISSA